MEVYLIALADKSFLEDGSLRDTEKAEIYQFMKTITNETQVISGPEPGLLGVCRLFNDKKFKIMIDINLGKRFESEIPPVNLNCHQLPPDVVVLKNPAVPIQEFPEANNSMTSRVTKQVENFRDMDKICYLVCLEVASLILSAYRVHPSISEGIWRVEDSRITKMVDYLHLSVENSVPSLYTSTNSNMDSSIVMDHINEELKTATNKHLTSSFNLQDAMNTMNEISGRIHHKLDKIENKKAYSQVDHIAAIKESLLDLQSKAQQSLDMSIKYLSSNVEETKEHAQLPGKTFSIDDVWLEDNEYYMVEITNHSQEAHRAVKLRTTQNFIFDEIEYIDLLSTVREKVHIPVKYFLESKIIEFYIEVDGQLASNVYALPLCSILNFQIVNSLASFRVRNNIELILQPELVINDKKERLVVREKGILEFERDIGNKLGTLHLVLNHDLISNQEKLV